MVAPADRSHAASDVLAGTPRKGPGPAILCSLAPLRTSCIPCNIDPVPKRDSDPVPIPSRSSNPSRDIHRQTHFENPCPSPRPQAVTCRDDGEWSLMPCRGAVCCGATCPSCATRCLQLEGPASRGSGVRSCPRVSGAAAAEPERPKMAQSCGEACRSVTNCRCGHVAAQDDI